MLSNFDNHFQFLNKKNNNRSIFYSSCLLFCIDIVALLLSVVVSRFLRWVYIEYPNFDILIEWDVQLFVERLALFGILSLFLAILFTLRGHYSTRRTPLFLFSDIIVWVGVMAVLDFSIAYLAQKGYPRLWSTLSWVIAPFLIVTCRFMTIYCLKKINAWNVPMVFLGDGEGWKRVQNLLHLNAFDGCTLIDCIIVGGRERSCIPFLDISSLNLERNSRILTHFEDEKIQEEILEEVLRHGHNVFSILPYRFNQVLSSNDIPLFGEQYVLKRFQNPLDNWRFAFVKRVMDIILAVALTLLSFAVLFMAVIWVSIVSPGNPFFYQKRIGHNGERFVCWKLRTMKLDSQRALSRWKKYDSKLWHAYQNNNFKLSDDPRLILGGCFLRKFSIDELPQIYNVLCGNMSIIGPRPILPREIKDYGEKISYYKRVSPGITGLWQVNGRSQTTFTERTELDVFYIRNWSIRFDIQILLKTFGTILLGKGE